MEVAFEGKLLLGPALSFADPLNVNADLFANIHPESRAELHPISLQTMSLKLGRTDRTGEPMRGEGWFKIVGVALFVALIATIVVGMRRSAEVSRADGTDFNSLNTACENLCDGRCYWDERESDFICVARR